MSGEAAVSGWVLSVDFGTSNTAAAVSEVGRADRGREVTLSASSTVMPSGVLVGPDEAVLTGESARNQAGAMPPGSYEPTLKRRLGEGTIVLGGQQRPVVGLLSEVLRAVADRARLRFNGSAPQALHLTHPAAWFETRQQLLRDAAQAAGLPPPLLVPEPVAAAAYYATTHGRNGPVAVYDLGGGTLDVAVLQPAGTGYEVVATNGLDPLGGELFDERLLELVRAHLTDRGGSDLWDQLTSDAGLAAQRTLLDSVRQAKHTLSEQPTAMVQVAVGDNAKVVTVTREEFIGSIRADLDRSVQAMRSVLHDADLEPDTLDHLYLVGGSSRIPAVAEALQHGLGIQIATFDDPKTVTCLGALHHTPTTTDTTPTPPPQDPPPPQEAPRREPEPPTPEPESPELRTAAGGAWGRPKMYAFAGAVVLLLAVLALIVWPRDPELVIVPDVIGMTGLDAAREVRSVGLRPIGHLDGAPLARVTAASPPPGSELERGEAVDLGFVDDGEEAREEVPPEDVEEGTTEGVIVETTPPVVVPGDLVGLSSGEARQRLEELGLEVELQGVDSSRPGGTVLATEPLPLSVLATGELVTLQFARWPSLEETFPAAGADGCIDTTPQADYPGLRRRVRCEHGDGGFGVYFDWQDLASMEGWVEDVASGQDVQVDRRYWLRSPEEVREGAIMVYPLEGGYNILWTVEVAIQSAGVFVPSARASTAQEALDYWSESPTTRTVQDRS